MHELVGLVCDAESGHLLFMPALSAARSAQDEIEAEIAHLITSCQIMGLTVGTALLGLDNERALNKLRLAYEVAITGDRSLGLPPGIRWEESEGTTTPDPPEWHPSP